MSDYGYDSDGDLVLVRQGTGTAARANDSRYSNWTQSELEKQMFSWSLQDVLNKNLLKKKVRESFQETYLFIFDFFIKDYRGYKGAWWIQELSSKEIEPPMFLN